MPETNYSRTILQGAIEQAGIGQTDIVAAVAGLRIYVVSMVFTLSAAGTITFNEGVGPTALSGIMPIAASGGLVDLGDGKEPVFSTATAGAKLGLVTVGAGATAHGWFRYFLST